MDAEETSIPQEPEASQKRRMPNNLRRFLIRMQGGKMYLPAAYRLVWFRDECPDWGIDTMLLEGGQEAGFATVQAKVFNAEGRLIASGMKTETRQDFPAGWTEKAETGAIARALAVSGFGTQFSQDLDEAEVAGRIADSPQPIEQPQAARADRPHIPANGAGTKGTPNTRETNCANCGAPPGRMHLKDGCPL